MKCENCGDNFRTINLPDYVERICYKCGFNNGKLIDDGVK